MFFKDEWTVQSRKVKRQHADNHDHGAHSDDDNEDSFSGSGADAMIAYGRRQKRGGFAAGAGFPAGAADDSGPRFGGGGGGRGGFHAVRGGSKKIQ